MRSLNVFHGRTSATEVKVRYDYGSSELEKTF